MNHFRHYHGDTCHCRLILKEKEKPYLLLRSQTIAFHQTTMSVKILTDHLWLLKYFPSARDPTKGRSYSVMLLYLSKCTYYLSKTVLMGIATELRLLHHYQIYGVDALYVAFDILLRPSWALPRQCWVWELAVHRFVGRKHSLLVRKNVSVL